MSGRHLGICRQNSGAGWLTLSRQDGQWAILGGNNASLASIIGGIITDMRKDGFGDFSFSDQRLRDLVELGSFAIEPPDLAALRLGIAVSVLCEEGREGDPTMWNAIHRDPRGRLSSPGIEGRFRRVSTPDQIEKWFGREVFASFEAAHPNEAHTPGGHIARPPHARELLVRHNWRARSIVGSAFPGPTASEKRAKQQAITAEYEARRKLKNPRERRLALQAQQQADAKLLPGSGISAEERDALNAARKAAYGLPWAERRE